MNSIMVVEDESIIALDLKTILIKMGFKIPAVVASGEEAVKIAANVSPDLIIMDIVLKGKMNGLVAGENIYTRHKIPILFLTSYNDDKIISEAKRISPFGILNKPFDKNQLEKKIKECFS